MRHSAIAMVTLVFVLGCWSSTNGNDEDPGSAETEKIDTGIEQKKFSLF